MRGYVTHEGDSRDYYSNTRSETAPHPRRRPPSCNHAMRKLPASKSGVKGAVCPSRWLIPCASARTIHPLQRQYALNPDPDDRMYRRACHISYIAPPSVTFGDTLVMRRPYIELAWTL